MSDIAEYAEPDLAQLARDGQMSFSELLAYTNELQSLGHPQAACNLYGLWLPASTDPQRHVAYFNYGTLLQSTGQTEQAKLAYQAALALQPHFAQASINLGLTHERLGQNEQALQAWAQVVGQRLLPHAPAVELQITALNHIGRVQEQLRNYLQAEQALEDSLRLNPRQPGVIQHWVHIRQKACKWPVYQELPGIGLGEMLRATSPLAMLALTDDPVQQLLTAQSFVARTYSMKEERLCEGRQYQHARLRIGYVSADLREHAVGFLLPAFFEGHDRTRYELYAYDFTQDENTATRRTILGLFDQVRSIHALDDRHAAQLILDDEIDILIDLHGLSSGARPGIFALHPAPRQGTYLGFIGSTGMPWFDFVLADRQVLPPELATHFTEKPLYLEGSFLPLAATPQPLPEVGRAQLGLAEQAFVMGAFGNVYKITPEMFASWMRLLQRMPDAVLWLIDDNTETTANLRAHARRAGVDPRRLVFASRCDHAHFCARLRLADVYLDTYPYNCGSTSRDVINAGVPLVSLYGQTMVSRMGLSILQSVGCAHLATSSLADYEDKVLEVYLKKKGGGRLEPYTMPTASPRIHAALEPGSAQAGGERASPGSALRGKGRKAWATGSPVQPARSECAGLQLYQWGRQGPGSGPLQPMQPPVGDAGQASGHDWIRAHLLQHTLDEHSFYGFLPPDFERATGLQVHALAELVRANARCDVLGLDAGWQASMFLNPFVQAEAWQPGLLAAAQQLADAMGLGLDLAVQPMHAGQSVLGSLFLARRRFWLRWLELGERLAGLALPPALEVLLQERLGCLLVLQGGWRLHCPLALAPQAVPAALADVQDEAVMADALKQQFAQSAQARCLQLFEDLSRRVLTAERLQALRGQ